MSLFSIITVNLNNSSGLHSTIESVINQTYCDFEFIVIDGGSTDASVNVLRKFYDKITFWVSEPDLGIYDAMNKGIEYANGEFLIFINSGDTFFENSIVGYVANLIVKNPGYDIFYGKILAENESSSFINGKELTIKDFKNGYLPDHQATFVRRSLFKRLGLYNIKLKIYADYDFMLKCFIEKRNFLYFDRIVSNYRLGGLSANDNSYLILILKYFGIVSFLKTGYLRKYLIPRIISKLTKRLKT